MYSILAKKIKKIEDDNEMIIEIIDAENTSVETTSPLTAPSGSSILFGRLAKFEHSQDGENNKLDNISGDINGSVSLSKSKKDPLDETQEIPRLSHYGRLAFCEEENENVNLDTSEKPRGKATILLF